MSAHNRIRIGTEKNKRVRNYLVKPTPDGTITPEHSIYDYPNVVNQRAKRGDRKALEIIMGKKF